MQADLGTKDEADCYWFCDEVKCAALKTNCFASAEVLSLAWFHSNSVLSSHPRRYPASTHTFYTRRAQTNGTAVMHNKAVINVMYLNVGCTVMIHSAHNEIHNTDPTI